MEGVLKIQGQQGQQGVRERAGALKLPRVHWPTGASKAKMRMSGLATATRRVRKVEHLKMGQKHEQAKRHTQAGSRG